VVAGMHRPSAGLRQSFSRVVRFISRENQSTGWQPETDRTRLSNFIAWIRPPLLQLESTSEFGKTTKCRQFVRFCLSTTSFPSFGRGFDSHRPSADRVLVTMFQQHGPRGRPFWGEVSDQAPPSITGKHRGSAAGSQIFLATAERLL
jgi:hypothetical protein